MYMILNVHIIIYNYIYINMYMYMYIPTYHISITSDHAVPTKKEKLHQVTR